jgi:hypothetical protein
MKCKKAFMYIRALGSPLGFCDHGYKDHIYVDNKIVKVCVSGCTFPRIHVYT